MGPALIIRNLTLGEWPMSPLYAEFSSVHMVTILGAGVTVDMQSEMPYAHIWWLKLEAGREGWRTKNELCPPCANTMYCRTPRCLRILGPNLLLKSFSRSICQYGAEYVFLLNNLFDL